MKKLVSFFAATMLAGLAFNANAQVQSYGEDESAITYFTWEYNDDPQSLKLGFPNAASADYNGNEAIAIRKAGHEEVRTYGDFARLSENMFNCVFREFLAPGKYYINARVDVFTCYGENDTEGTLVPDEKFVINFAIPGTQDNPIIIGDEEGETVPGPGPAENFGDSTYYRLDCNYEGILTITNNTNAWSTTLLLNGKPYCNSIPKNGGRIEVLVNRHDVVELRAMTQETARDKDYVFNYRPVEDGEIWNRPIELIEGENLISYVASSSPVFITVPHYYKLQVTGGTKAYIDFDDFGIYGTANVDEAAEGTFADAERSFTFEPELTDDLYIQVKNVASENNETICHISFEGGEHTAIQAIVSNTKSQAFDLFGRRTNANGFQVINGQKTLVK